MGKFKICIEATSFESDTANNDSFLHHNNHEVKTTKFYSNQTYKVKETCFLSSLTFRRELQDFHQLVHLKKKMSENQQKN